MALEESMQIPHIPGSEVLTFLSILMYPASPQLVPQEFLTFQKGVPLSVPYPTAVIPWFKEVPQLLS